MTSALAPVLCADVCHVCPHVMQVPTMDPAPLNELLQLVSWHGWCSN